MNRACVSFVLTLMSVCCAVGQTAGQTAAPAAAQKATGKGESYVPPKTPWGDPDLQGLWPNQQDIPLERDRSLGTQLYLTDEQAKANQARIDKKKAADEAFEGDGHIGFGAPPYWIEYGPAGRQSSLIVDPPDGRLPPLTADAIARRKGQKVPAARDRPEDIKSPADFDYYDRCISRGILGSVRRAIYNNGNQILQEPGYVIIRHEMIHEARIIPLDGRPHVNEKIRLYMGNSRGHWEGNTLVVETTNINSKIPIFQAGSNIDGSHTDRAHLVERFKRIAPDQLRYELTVDDPDTWTRPWTVRVPLAAEPTYQLYEYGCHEANYSQMNVLQGNQLQAKEDTEHKGEKK